MKGKAMNIRPTHLRITTTLLAALPLVCMSCGGREDAESDTDGGSAGVAGHVSSDSGSGGAVGATQAGGGMGGGVAGGSFEAGMGGPAEVGMGGRGGSATAGSGGASAGNGGMAGSSAEDAGLPDSGVVCNSLVDDAAPAKITFVSDDSPEGAGGKLVDGRYALTEMKVYQADAGNPAPTPAHGLSGTWVIANMGTVMQQAVHTNGREYREMDRLQSKEHS